jgi:hypothetical protein
VVPFSWRNYLPSGPLLVAELPGRWFLTRGGNTVKWSLTRGGLQFGARFCRRHHQQFRSNHLQVHDVTVPERVVARTFGVVTLRLATRSYRLPMAVKWERPITSSLFRESAYYWLRN